MKGLLLAHKDCPVTLQQKELVSQIANGLCKLSLQLILTVSKNIFGQIKCSFFFIITIQTQKHLKNSSIFFPVILTMSGKLQFLMPVFRRFNVLSLRFEEPLQSLIPLLRRDKLTI